MLLILNIVATFITATKRKSFGARTWNGTTANLLLKWNTAWSLLSWNLSQPCLLSQPGCCVKKDFELQYSFLSPVFFFFFSYAGEILSIGLGYVWCSLTGWLFLLRLAYHLNPVHLSPTAEWKRVCVWLCVYGCISYPFTLVIVIIDLPYGSRGSRAMCLQHKTYLPHQGRISYWLP